MTVEILGHLIQTENILYISPISQSRQHLYHNPRWDEPTDGAKWYLTFSIYFSKDFSLQLDFYEKDNLYESASEIFMKTITEIRESILSHSSEIKKITSNFIDEQC